MPRTKPQQNPKTRRAAIYARVSDKSQSEDDKTSIAEQLSDMETYCSERGYDVTVRYQEVGRGWSKSRPEFRSAMPLAAASIPAGRPKRSAMPLSLLQETTV